MPIRINLLAEAQAAEEARRRDPVKRAVWVGVMAVAAVLTWISVLQARITLQKSEKSRLEFAMQAINEQYEVAVKEQKELAAARSRLLALHRYSTNRFFTGNLLNALQQGVVEDVRLIKLNTTFNYAYTEATRPRTNSAGTVLEPGKPATSRERIVVTLQAEDACGSPGDLVNLYRQSVAALPHFAALGRSSEDTIRLTGLNPPATHPSGRSFVLFTLECAYPEVVR